MVIHRDLSCSRGPRHAVAVLAALLLLVVLAVLASVATAAPSPKADTEDNAVSTEAPSEPAAPTTTTPIETTTSTTPTTTSASTATVAAADSGSSAGGPGTVSLLTTSLPAMAAGQKGWVSLNWQVSKWDATSFRVTASEATGAVAISYPENTESYSSLYRESFLLAGGTDYTSFYLDVSPGARESVEIVFVVSYDQHIGNGKGKGEQKHIEEQRTLKLDLVDASADAVALATDELTLSASAPSWQELALSARGPGVTDVRVTVAGPSGLEVVYPGDRDASGLRADAGLDEGETDVAAVRLDAAKVPPGRYPLTVRVRFGRSQEVRRDLDLTVTR